MPIIINEIEILVTVAEGENAGTDANGPSVKEEIIKECVEQVMAIINSKNER
jgi:hypothetical protein